MSRRIVSSTISVTSFPTWVLNKEWTEIKFTISRKVSILYPWLWWRWDTSHHHPSSQFPFESKSGFLLPSQNEMWSNIVADVRYQTTTTASCFWLPPLIWSQWERMLEKGRKKYGSNKAGRGGGEREEGLKMKKVVRCRKADYQAVKVVLTANFSFTFFIHSFTLSLSHVSSNFLLHLLRISILHREFLNTSRRWSKTLSTTV